MSALMHMVIENYNEVLESKKDGVVDSWLFMSSPVPVLTILVLYLYFVLKLGPQLMEKRPYLNLKNVLIAYNAYQVLFNLWLCTLVFRERHSIFLLFTECSGFPPNSALVMALSNGAWWYFFSKIVDLLDTVFFVLRKKQSQVTFLHVYHHSMVMFFSWAYLKFLPGEQGVVIGLLNSAVHAVMYSYYLIAALGPEYQKYLWWKKYMTWIQLIQFFIILAYLMFLIAMDCKAPKALTFFLIVNAIIFVYLFVDFYRKEYNKSRASFVKNKKANKIQ